MKSSGSYQDLSVVGPSREPGPAVVRRHLESCCPPYNVPKNPTAARPANNDIGTIPPFSARLQRWTSTTDVFRSSRHLSPNSRPAQSDIHEISLLSRWLEKTFIIPLPLLHRVLQLPTSSLRTSLSSSSQSPVNPGHFSNLWSNVSSPRTRQVDTMNIIPHLRPLFHAGR